MKKILYAILTIIIFSSILAKITGYQYFSLVNLYTKMSPYPVIASKQNGLELYSFEAEALINQEKKISLNNYLAETLECSHRQIITEIIIIQYINLSNKNELESFMGLLFCQNSCVKKIIEKKENLKIKKIELSLKHKGDIYFGKTICNI